MKNLTKKIGAVALAVAVLTSSSMAADRGMTEASNFAQPQAKVMAFDGIPSNTITDSELADTNGEFYWFAVAYLSPYAYTVSTAILGYTMRGGFNRLWERYNRR